MPIGPGPNGPYGTTAQLPIVFGTLTFPGAGVSLFTVDLHADGLPGLNAWFLQTAGAGTVSVQLQFAQGQIVAGVNWKPLIGAYSLVSGTPSLVNPRLGSRRYRALLTTAVGGATVDYRLTASLS